LKNIVILGSTGSIGMNTLDVVDRFRDRFNVLAISAKSNIKLLKEQILRFNPRFVAVYEKDAAKLLKENISNKVEVYHGLEGLNKIATLKDADLVVSAISGSQGLIPTWEAIRAKKRIALANKEILVMAGNIIMEESRKNGVEIIPIDSEHSAIFQSLLGHSKKDIRRIILTASGGPFYNYPYEKLKNVTPEEAIIHPRWNMGKKVSIDSASLMNKGLEVIEARWLFNIEPDKIDINIHPESIVHSMVEYRDGSVIAQLGIPDMRGPISYAISYPERLDINLPSLNLFEIKKLTFFKPDKERFPNIELAYRALKEGNGMCIVLNAANEIAVESFLNRMIKFTEIYIIIKRVMDIYKEDAKEVNNINKILMIDKWAREKAKDVISYVGVYR
jgi:1-deoxy-D-xylulose-5-phosphate reductoisomerase